MANEFQQKKKLLLEKLFREHPEVLLAKRFTGLILLIWLITRIISLCAEYYCASLEIISFSIPNLISTLFSALFVWTIYQGFKVCVYLPIIGGAFMVIQTFTNQLYALLSPEFIPAVRIYSLAFIISAFAQLILLVYVCVNKKSNVYFDAIKEIADELGLNRNNNGHL